MLDNRNLRFLVTGQFVSAIGDQFYLIAMPWLALELTGSALVAGTVLAAASLPRAVFMILGGSASDRYSPKSLLIGSNGLQGLLMAGLALAVLADITPLWLLYAGSFLVGLVDAFGLPAFNSMLPLVVPTEGLERGNLYLQGANMASGAIGPALAGALIAAAPGAAAAGALPGLGLAFLVNAATYVVGISFFAAMRASSAGSPSGEPPKSLLESLRSLADYLRANDALRVMLGLMLMIGLLLAGTIRVGFPLLAEREFAGGAEAFGWMSSAFGAGTVAGMLAAGWLPKPPDSHRGLLLLVLTGALPLGLILLGLGTPFGPSLAIIAAMGAGLGYVMISLVSWLQATTPAPLMGRMMAVVMFATIGLSPVSQTIMGLALDWNLLGTLLTAGGLALLILTLTAADRRRWALAGAASSWRAGE